MVYVLLADGFEEMEALVPYDVLKRADVDVRFVSVTENITVTGTHNVAVRADMTCGEITDEPLEMLVLPGGMPGMTNLHAFSQIDDLLSRARYRAAICASPSVLGLHGFLKGKKATCYPGFEENLIGAEVVDERLVCDGEVITAKGAGVSFEFALALVQCLKGPDVAERVRAAMQ